MKIHEAIIDGVRRNPEGIIERIVSFIREQVKAFNREGAIMGLSGGIDSALGAFLTVCALGRENVFFLFLPERDSSRQSKRDAELVADALKVELKEVNLTPLLRKIGVYRLEPPAFGIPRRLQERYVLRKYGELQDENETTYLKNLKGGAGKDELKRGIAYYRIKHRLRMVLWYFYGELSNYLVIGNCNKTEKLTGYFIKYGDSGSDIDVISGLYKTQVRELARYMGIPRRILEKAPSPDIMPGMTDEYALQMKYDRLDGILYGLEKGMKAEEIKEGTGAGEREIMYVKELVELSRHMRELPPSPDLKGLL